MTRFKIVSTNPHTGEDQFVADLPFDQVAQILNDEFYACLNHGEKIRAIKTLRHIVTTTTGEVLCLKQAKAIVDVLFPS